MSNRRRIGRPENSINLPFEEGPTGQTISDEFEISGGLVVMAAVAPVDGVGPSPALVFRFARPDGRFYPARILVCDAEDLHGLVPLVAKAVPAAIRAAGS